MQTLLRMPARRLSEAVCLKVNALFEQSGASLDSDARSVPPVCVTVRYLDGQPVTGLGSENFSMVNAEDSSDLTHLFCVSGFASLQEAGVYEIAMQGATWSGCKTKSHCCLVYVTRFVPRSHAIEFGRVQCCMP